MVPISSREWLLVANLFAHTQLLIPYHLTVAMVRDGARVDQEFVDNLLKDPTRHQMGLGMGTQRVEEFQLLRSLMMGKLHDHLFDEPARRDKRVFTGIL